MGLGNPGSAYATSRHNAGFMAVDALARRWDIPLTTRAAARTGDGMFADRPVTLLAPLTFMNRSGDALADDPPSVDDRLVVVHDDLDLAAGQLRVRADGGSGGHRGVESIAARIGADFIRVRVGIGRPPVGVETSEYVLEPLMPSARAALQTTVERACDAVECLLSRGLVVTMNRFNGAATAREPIQTTKE